MENASSPFDKRQGYRILFRNQDFRNLWLGQVFSQLGDRVVFVVFVAIIANAFGSSTSIQSWLYVAFTIPAILLTAIAGVFIDKCNKKWVMIVANILRAIIIGLLPLFNDSLIHIYMLAFLLSGVTQFFVPSEASMIPMIVNKHQLMIANSVFTTTMMASIIFGFALGDPLINIFGLKSVHISISVMFLISTLFLAAIRYKPATQEAEGHKTIKDFVDDLKAGFIYTKNNPKLYNAIFKLAMLFSTIVMISILTIGLSQQYLYPHNPVLGAQKFVYIIASSGIGMVLGSIILGNFFRNFNKYKLIFSGFSIIGIGMFLIALIGFIPNNIYLPFNGMDVSFIHLEPFKLTLRMIYSYVIAGIIGLNSAFVAIPIQTILHGAIREDMRGKVFGLQFTVLSTSSTFPVIIAAFGADVIGITKMFGIIGFSLLAFGFVNLFKLNKQTTSN